MSPAMVEQSRQHPVCAFIYSSSSTLRNSNKCTEGQTCSILKEVTRVPCSLGPYTLPSKGSLKMSIVMHNALAKIYVKLGYLCSKGNSRI